MKKANRRRDPDPEEMAPEVDFSHMVRGKFAKRFAGGVKAVVLDADVSKAFPDARSVNNALRSLVLKHKTA